MVNDDFKEKQNFINSAIFNELNKIRKGSKIKECFYFDHSECDKIIRAHSIQENKILNKISDNGKVIAVDNSKLPFLDIEEIGISKASVFTGFCGYHDNKLFRPIEIHDYMNTPEQNFLYAYRAFAKETHTKKENKNLISSASKNLKKIENINIANDLVSNLDTALVVDAEFIGNKFKNGFLKNDYSELITKIFTFEYEVKIAVAAALSPTHDINGKRINDLKNNKKPANVLFFNIFPENGKTFLLFSWFKYANSVYEKWFYHFLNLTEDQKINFLNLFIPREVENFYINPQLWDSWGKDGQDSYKENFTSLFLSDKINYKERTLYNLFEKI